MQEAVLHVTAAELREIGCKPGHIKKFMKRLMDLQTIVLTKNEAAVRDWVYSLRPRRGAVPELLHTVVLTCRRLRRGVGR